MIFDPQIFVFLTYAAMTLLLHCEAVCPPPTRLSYIWLDPFTVNMSWEKPRELLNSSDVSYKCSFVKNGKDKSVTGTNSSNITATCLTEDMDSDHWNFNVWTDTSQSCNTSNKITRFNFTFKKKKPPVQVVKDLKCVIQGNETDCSWIPVNNSLNLTLKYRNCGRTEERLKSLKVCDQLYSRGARMGCRLKVDNPLDDICVLTETEAGIRTFKAELEVPSPKLSITQEGNKLKVTWDHPEFGRACIWIYQLCYTKCNHSKVCENFNMRSMEEVPTVTLHYDENCRYEFQSRVRTDTKYCPKINSDVTEVVTYGTNKPPDVTLTVVAIVVPIILTLCVLLSCYCLRRHRTIICPNIPDPSAIFKEMMMNGNKDLKTTTGSLYTPVPEPIEQCRITPVNENIVLQQNI